VLAVDTDGPFAGAIAIAVAAAAFCLTASCSCGVEITGAISVPSALGSALNALITLCPSRADDATFCQELSRTLALGSHVSRPLGARRQQQQPLRRACCSATPGAADTRRATVHPECHWISASTSTCTAWMASTRVACGANRRYPALAQRRHSHGGGPEAGLRRKAFRPAAQTDRSSPRSSTALAAQHRPTGQCSQSRHLRIAHPTTHHRRGHAQCTVAMNTHNSCIHPRVVLHLLLVLGRHRRPWRRSQPASGGLQHGRRK